MTRTGRFPALLLALALVATGLAGAAAGQEGDADLATVAPSPATDAASPLLGEPSAPTAGEGGATSRASERLPDDPATARLFAHMLEEATRVEGEPRRIGLADAVRAAVAGNPGIRADAEVPAFEAWSAFGATAPFDPEFRAEILGSDQSIPSASALASGLTTFEEEALRSSASISKLLRSGASMDLTWATQRIDANSLFLLLNPRYDNRLTLSLRQPLLRGIAAMDERTTVLVARARAEESLAAFEAHLARFAGEVIDAYWAWVQAAAELEVSRRSVLLAEELVRDAEARVKVGLLAPVAIKEAAADAASREETALVAENTLLVAGRVLSRLVMLGAGEGGAPAPVIPAEEHMVTPVETDRVESLRAALEQRPEIRAAQIALGRSRLEERRANNARLPDLALVARYGLVGLAGDARPVVDENGNVQFSPFDGSYGDSLSEMFSGDYHDAGVGLELRVPFGNADARARAAQAEIEVRRASRLLHQAVSDVALDVERALADLASSAKRVTASTAARELAEENLGNQKRRYELGNVTTKDVLDFQERLAQAMAVEVRAITDHARSVARLRQAEGTLLARFDIRVERPDAPGTSWWYRF